MSRYDSPWWGWLVFAGLGMAVMVVFYLVLYAILTGAP